MSKVLIAVIIVLFNLLKWAYYNLKEEKSNYILISLFVILISFNFSFPIYSYLTEINLGEFEIDKLGEFGNSFRLNSFFLIIPLCLFLGYTKLPARRNKGNNWLVVVLCFAIISIFNPFNPFPNSILIFLFYACQLLVSMEYLKANFSRETIFRGIYEGLLFVTLLQLLITVCYPILNIEYFATLFKGDASLESSLKREGYVSAIGIFGHPGPLAIYCLYVGVFFFSCYLNGYRKKLSTVLLFVNIFIILFTFSRTTYLTSILVFLILFASFRNKKGMFSLKNILTVLLGFSLLIFVLYLTPLRELFLGSDFESQIEVRFSSWFLGYEIWKNAPLFGVGINSHVYYMGHVLKISEDLFIIDFLTTNPIHNIHMIILAETGIVGFLIWINFFRVKLIEFMKLIRTEIVIANILNLTFIGVLISTFTYGMFGWAPFNREILTTAFLLSYFSFPKSEIMILWKNSIRSRLKYVDV